MSIEQTAIFIEPSGTLKASLIERKRTLEAALPRQAYTNHPPHCTLLFGSYGTPEIWIERLRTALQQLSAFPLSTDKWQEFPNDIQAAGGHTVAYRVVSSPELHELQSRIASTIAPFRKSFPHPHPLADREPFASSLERFGFPFVGPHWIPHFTIGSPRVPSNAPLLANLMSGPVAHTMPVNTVSVWRVKADHHERLCVLALEGNMV